MRQRLFFLVCLLACCPTLQAQNSQIINGFIYDADSKEALIGAVVYDAFSETGAVTNSYGYYSLFLKSPAQAALQVSFTGYQTSTFAAGYFTVPRFDILLKPGIELSEVTIRANRPSDISRTTETSIVRLPMRDVKRGDYLISINGNNITTKDNPYLFLENLADVPVQLTVNSRPSADGARTSTVKPIESELEIMHLDWVQQRRAMVDSLSGGKIGYIYVPNTSFEGNRELFRGMYAYNDKDALIIDDRYNGGGFIPENMINLLDRKTLTYWARNHMQPNRAPGIAHDGPKVMLINGYSSSGGDAFPYFFRKLNLGKLIGTRTWGGLVGISGNARLVDGGYISVPRFGIFDENSEWIIEGVGVYPDIEVVDRPEQLAKGIDPGVEKAVEVLLKELEANPVKKVKSPVPPNRSGWIEIEIK